jgi:C4-dicarboxylate-specific signal transduction histidine kinase
MKQLCTIQPHVGRVDNLSLEQSNLIKTLESHCRTLLGALIERESVWFNKFNSQRNRMTRSVDSKECTNPHPLYMQSSAFRMKRQALVGAFLVLGLVAAASSNYSAMQLAALSTAQDDNVQLLQEHETRLSVTKQSIELINSTVLRLGKKVAELSNTLGTDELILQLGFSLDSVFEDSTRILRGMNALADNRLSPDFVKTCKMTATLLRLENSMQREGYEPWVGDV